MYDDLIKDLREKAEFFAVAEPLNIKNAFAETMKQAADAIEELSKRINRAVELYDRGVERSAMYEALKGISPEPPKEEA